ncbi:MAG: hypothetical protein ACYTHN_16105 [Planctomycetota bacterium]
MNGRSPAGRNDREPYRRGGARGGPMERGTPRLSTAFPIFIVKTGHCANVNGRDDDRDGKAKDPPAWRTRGGPVCALA